MVNFRVRLSYLIINSKKYCPERANLIPSVDLRKRLE